mmetsp:Transcript_72694/g.199425  ORF Transcript_72694/g.199425 Transcript_72694/m.199425 type:complete len:389 (-) Transcript_72694:14-1180(-)
MVDGGRTLVAALIRRWGRLRWRGHSGGQRWWRWWAANVPPHRPPSAPSASPCGGSSERSRAVGSGSHGARRAPVGTVEGLSSPCAANTWLSTGTPRASPESPELPRLSSASSSGSQSPAAEPISTDPSRPEPSGTCHEDSVASSADGSVVPSSLASASIPSRHIASRPCSSVPSCTVRCGGAGFHGRAERPYGGTALPARIGFGFAGCVTAPSSFRRTLWNIEVTSALCCRSPSTSALKRRRSRLSMMRACTLRQRCATSCWCSRFACSSASSRAVSAAASATRCWWSRSSYARSSAAWYSARSSSSSCRRDSSPGRCEKSTWPLRHSCATSSVSRESSTDGSIECRKSASLSSITLRSASRWSDSARRPSSKAEAEAACSAISARSC